MSRLVRGELHVAVVLSEGRTTSERPDGDYSCFVADSEDEAVMKAIRARDRWGARGFRNKYEIYVGKLQAKVTPLSSYNLVPLPCNTSRPCNER